jgi:hypothetical protein
MSGSGLDAINSGPLVIRTYLDGSPNNTYLFQKYDVPVPSNYLLLTSTNGRLAPTDQPYLSSVTVSSLTSFFDQTEYLSCATLTAASIYGNTMSSNLTTASTLTTGTNYFTWISGSTITTSTLVVSSLLANTMVASTMLGSTLNTSSLITSSISTNSLYFTTGIVGDLSCNSVTASTLTTNSSIFGTLSGSTLNTVQLNAPILTLSTATFQQMTGSTMILSTVFTSSMSIGNFQPNYALDVTGDINFTGNLYQNRAPFTVTIPSANQWTTSGSNLYYVTGNVGIGTNAPSYVLDVVGTTQCNSASVGGTALTITGNVGIGTATPNAALQVIGAINATTKNFDIPHPTQPSKRLVHSCIEGPRIDLLYRGSVTLVGGVGVVEINRDSTSSPECAMTPGTFEALTVHPVFYLQNTTSFDRVIGALTGATLTIRCQNPQSTDVIAWMVIAERADEGVKSAAHTNKEGRLITEYSNLS